MTETADLMLAFDAYNALNLDGGGSTVMMKSDGRGGAMDLNRPSGGVERYDADSLGVFALPLATPEPSTFALFGAAILILAFSQLRIGRSRKPKR